VEKKAAGAPLIQEFRRMGIPVQEYTPSRGARGTSNDKIARMNSIADIFASGRVWAPDRRWAKEVIEEVASFPQGDFDDYCLAAGTKIRMNDGSEKNIEAVVVGDLVATPQGPCRVVASGCTGMKELWELQTAHGSLRGSGNHPIFSAGKWIRLDKLVPGVDTVASYQGAATWWKQCCSTGRNTGAILKEKTRRIDAILGGLVRGCIGMFGSFTTALFLQGSMCTIKMGIPRTTAWKIWSAYPQKNTAPSTRKGSEPLENLKSSLCTSQKFALKPLNGIGLKQGVRGIKSTLHQYWLKHEHTFPNLVVKKISLLLAFGAGRKGLLRLVMHAFAAARAKLQNLDTVLVSDVRCTHTTQPVYNLTVEGAHCYFANSILSHNCDTVSQALMRFRQGGFITIDSDEQEEERRARRRNTRPYY
jgi:hypothetical protein